MTEGLQSISGTSPKPLNINEIEHEAVHKAPKIENDLKRKSITDAKASLTLFGQAVMGKGTFSDLFKA